MYESHDLVLRESGSFGTFHHVPARSVQILDVREAERTATILVTAELGFVMSADCYVRFWRHTLGLTDRCGGVILTAELDDTSALGAAVALVLDFGTFYFANSGKELDQVVIAGRPWQLCTLANGNEETFPRKLTFRT